MIIFILTDPTMVSINHIQKAQKQADNGFNDVIAQLYQDTFKTQQKAKEEHIRQAKEKAIEEQRQLEEKHKQDIERQRQETEAINQARERERKNRTVSSDTDPQNSDNSEAGVQAPETPQPTTSTAIANDWSQVSPEQASQYMSARTGVPVSTWQGVIFRESSNNPYALNSLGCFGYLQIMQNVHGNVSTWTPQAYLDKAVEIYQSQGARAWEAW